MTITFTLDFTSQQRIDGDVLERAFVIDGIPGVLWTPARASADAPVPLVLLGHPGGLDRMLSRLRGRAQSAAAQGFAAVTIELPGSGARPPLDGVEAARADMRRALPAGERVPSDVVDRLVLPLVGAAVPEWQRVLDAVLALPEVGGPVAYSGGIISIGVRLATAEPRVVAAGLFAGSFVPGSILEEARRVTIPVHVLLQWDDESNDRQTALDLFDAFGSAEKTLQANLGGHRGVPPWAGEDAARFFARHLR
ncbi:MAG: alpha/beta hydrolase [Leifsonia sp.]|uniref:alpha/beta hydrolase n=1 Tax=Leifsonia sp. TaxID=1870902 RepID=UPI003F7E4B88